MRNITNVNNKLIAEFMGGKLSAHSPNLINIPQTIGDAKIHCVKGSELLPNGTYSLCYLHELKYHSSWDWLMSVVNKIRTIASWDRDKFDTEVIIKGDRTIIKSGGYGEKEHGELFFNKTFFGGFNSNDHTYNAVVEFIQWYNKEKK